VEDLVLGGKGLSPFLGCIYSCISECLTYGFALWLLSLQQLKVYEKIVHLLRKKKFIDGSLKAGGL